MYIIRQLAEGCKENEEQESSVAPVISMVIVCRLHSICVRLYLCPYRCWLTVTINRQCWTESH